MRARLIAYLEALISRSKIFEKLSKASTGAEYSNHFSFSKACYCSASQIHGCCYYNNLEIGKAI